MSDTREFFFEKIMKRVLKTSYAIYKKPWEDEESFDLIGRYLLLSAILLYCGRILYLLFVIEERLFNFLRNGEDRLFNFLRNGGMFMVIISIVFLCYVLSITSLGS